MSSAVAKAARRVQHELHGVVVSSGLMDKTVKVRVGSQKWNNVVNKFYSVPKHYLVHDPNTSLRTGDVVSIVPGWPTSQHKRHVVNYIIAPYGVPTEDRPPVPTLEERIADREAKKATKDERKASRTKEQRESIADQKRQKEERWEAKQQAQKEAQMNQRQRNQQPSSSSDVD